MGGKIQSEEYVSSEAGVVFRRLDLNGGAESSKREKAVLQMEHLRYRIQIRNSATLF